MLVFSDLSYRMKDNARTFFMVAIISTVAFSAIGTLVGLNSFLTSGLKEANPISFVYTGEDETDETFEKTFYDYELTTEKGEEELTYLDQNGLTILVTTADYYNAFARLGGEKEIVLENDQVTVVEQSAANMMVPENDLKNSFVIVSDGAEVAVNKNLVGIAKPNVL